MEATLTTCEPTRPVLKVPIHSIKENPHNPRTITEEKFRKLVKSLQQFPEMLEARPIVVDENNVVLGGNMRLKAAKAAGLEEVHIFRSEWSHDKNSEFIIKDNVGFGEWDWDMLANEWEAYDLEDWGLDVWVPEEEKEGLTDPDEVPQVPADPVTQLGDLWILGDHRLLCGDSTKAEDVERLMDGEKADMVFTDPPYGMSYQSNRTKSAKFTVLENDDKIIDDWLPLATIYSSGFCFVWTTWKVLDQWLAVTKDFATLTNMVVWDKGGGGIGDLKKTYSTDHEIALVFNRGAELTGKRIGSVWGIGKDRAIDYVHPTQKPVALAEQALSTTTNRGEIILDFFLGSGSTLIAAEKTGRKCYGMELDPKYCDVIVKRWEDFTGQKASKANA